MDELVKHESPLNTPQPEDAYRSIRAYMVEAQRQVYTTVNAAMVTAYWNIGKAIYEICGENGRAPYGKQVLEYERIVKDPYVLEFLDLPPNEHYYESDLEQALIDHLQKFLLELGRGFSFVARQKHFSVDGRHFYIDLVFYNYILKCFVLIDLKTEDLTHQDIGQMQMYVNYYTRELMNEGDNPPIGILLCADKSDTLVRYTLPEENWQIYAAKYMPYLPTEAELKRELNNLDAFEKLEAL